MSIGGHSFTVITTVYSIMKVCQIMHCVRKCLLQTFDYELAVTLAHNGYECISFCRAKVYLFFINPTQQNSVLIYS